MRKIITTTKYYCDYCGDDVGNAEHVLIEDASRLGFVSPPKWQVSKPSRRYRRTYQFCNPLCFAHFLLADNKTSLNG